MVHWQAVQLKETLLCLPPAKKKQPAAVETSNSIEEQTRAFLKTGGKIQNIQSGISGQPGGYAARPSGAGRK